MDATQDNNQEPPNMAEGAEGRWKPSDHTESLPEVREEPDENMDSETREALQYWGYLGTEKLSRLMEGIARYIATHFEPHDDCQDLTPSQLAAFYRAVGGNYDILFVDTHPASIAFIYKSLRCLHSIQPAPESDGSQPPSIPALKAKGFVTWQTIQLLLGPDEHVPFIQNAVRQFDLIDPVEQTQFPKILPKECFPERPDEKMTQWYEQLVKQLNQEAEAAARISAAGSVDGSRRTHDSTDDWSSADEMTDAAEYFSSSLNRSRGRKGGVSRGYSRASPRLPRDYGGDRGRAVTHRVRHVVNPELRNRRKNSDDRYSDEVLDDELTPTGLHPRYVPRRSPRPRSPSIESIDSESDRLPPRRSSRSPRRESPRRPSPHVDRARHSPVLRHRRSHDPPSSPRDYFPNFEHHHRRFSDQVEPETVRHFGPSKAPPFAAQVAHLSARNVYNSRTGLRERANYEREHEYENRESRRSPSSALRDRSSTEPEGSSRYDRPSYTRARDRFSRDNRSYSEDQLYGRDLDAERGRERRPMHRYVTPIDGVGGRRYPLPEWR